jgi:hypothetical protein
MTAIDNNDFNFRKFHLLQFQGIERDGRDRPSLPFGHLPLYGEKAFRMDTLPIKGEGRGEGPSLPFLSIPNN